MKVVIQLVILGLAAWATGAQHPPPPPKMPPGWESIWSQEHEAFYYWHVETSRTTWEHPGFGEGDDAGGEVDSGVAGQYELTKESWDEATAGKAIFVKFFAPWCGHCKAMKPAWDALMKEYEGHASILIAEVDCTSAGKDKCEEVGVAGFPSIKYGDPNNLEDYEGERELEAFRDFAKTNLGPQCGPTHLDLCDAEKKALVNKFLVMPAEELDKNIAEKMRSLEKLDEEAEEFVKGLQAQLDEARKKGEEEKAAIKAKGLGLMKSVLAERKRSGGGQEEL